MELPVKSPKNERRIEERTILILEYQDRYVIRKRPDKGLLAGLWELPGMNEYLTPEGVFEMLSEWGMKPDRIDPAGKAKHIFTHIEWHMLGYHVYLKEKSFPLEEGQYIWADRQELKESYTLPNAFKAYMNMIR